MPRFVLACGSGAPCRRDRRRFPAPAAGLHCRRRCSSACQRSHHRYRRKMIPRTCRAGQLAAQPLVEAAVRPAKGVGNAVEIGVGQFLQRIGCYPRPDRTAGASSAGRPRWRRAPRGRRPARRSQTRRHRRPSTGRREWPEGFRGSSVDRSGGCEPPARVFASAHALSLR